MIEHPHIVSGLPSAADRYDTNPAGDVVSMGNFTDFKAVLDEGAGGTGTVKITVEACDDFTPSNTAQVPFKYRVCSSGDTWSDWADATASGGYTTVAGANKRVEVWAKAADLPEGKPNLRVQLTEVVNSPCNASLIYYLSGARYRKAVMDTAIA